MDRIIASIILVFFSPIIILLLFIILINYKCNPIFIQERTVSGGHIFEFYKIRSMRKAAPSVPTPEFRDPTLYINRTGRLLRLYSLDESLNLISIVRGDMKFIGPRPIMLQEYELITMRMRNGINCKAGVTGLAQINGRDKISVNRKIACERYYNRHKNSLKLRFYIIIKTIWVVLSKSGVSH
jgi:O-antigen biosynthesis protein WbqP